MTSTNPAAGIDWDSVRGQFMLAEDETYLNAGTYSAMPRPVYDELIRLIAAGEANPTRVAAGRLHRPYWEAQGQLAAYLGADPRDIVLHVNVTQALNQALLGYQWDGGGEFVASDKEYGSIVIAAREMARRSGMTYRAFELPNTVQSDDQIVDIVLRSIAPDTRGVLLSHVTTGAGILTPVDRIAEELRRRNIRLFVDGAHAPGLTPLSLGRTRIDFYGGNLHKWFMGPKGTGFLYAAKEFQRRLRPGVVGFGGTWESGPAWHDEEHSHLSRFQSIFRTQGLIDASAVLALPAVLRFRQSLGEQAILDRIAELAAYTRERIGALNGVVCDSPSPAVHRGLTRFLLPVSTTGRDLQEELFRRFRITVPVWGDGPRTSLRVSAHIWNGAGDIDLLAEALKQLL